MAVATLRVTIPREVFFWLPNAQARADVHFVHFRSRPAQEQALKELDSRCKQIVAQRGTEQGVPLSLTEWRKLFPRSLWAAVIDNYSLALRCMRELGVGLSDFRKMKQDVQDSILYRVISSDEITEWMLGINFRWTATDVASFLFHVNAEELHRATKLGFTLDICRAKYFTGGVVARLFGEMSLHMSPWVLEWFVAMGATDNEWNACAKICTSAAQAEWLHSRDIFSPETVAALPPDRRSEARARWLDVRCGRSLLMLIMASRRRYGRKNRPPPELWEMVREACK